jgi:hypothetical protein
MIEITQAVLLHLILIRIFHHRQAVFVYSLAAFLFMLTSALAVDVAVLNKLDGLLFSMH